MTVGAELRDFLVSRRARVTPASVGLSAGLGVRRVPGLRREEVAELADISVDYYIELERGRVNGVSESVLNSVARALRLTEAERVHLFDLAHPPRGSGDAEHANVRPGLLLLLDSLQDVPAMIQGPRTEVLAANRLADALYLNLNERPQSERNITRFVFSDPRSTLFYGDWERSARECVAMLRLARGRRPADVALQQMIQEMQSRSRAFSALWAERDVRLHISGTKVLRHPEVGELTVYYESLETGDHDRRLVTFAVEPGTLSRERLMALSSHHPPGDEVVAPQ